MGAHSTSVFENLTPEQHKMVIEIELLFRDSVQRFGPRFAPFFRQPARDERPDVHLRHENEEVDRFEDAKAQFLTALMNVAETDEIFAMTPTAGHQQLKRLRELLLQVPTAL